MALAVGCKGDESDIVWLAEDDYLYRAEALERLLSAAPLIPWASYFALYAAFPPLEPEMRRRGGTASRLEDGATGAASRSTATSGATR